MMKRRVVFTMMVTGCTDLQFDEDGDPMLREFEDFRYAPVAYITPPFGDEVSKDMMEDMLRKTMALASHALASKVIEAIEKVADVSIEAMAIPVTRGGLN